MKRNPLKGLMASLALGLLLAYVFLARSLVYHGLFWGIRLIGLRGNIMEILTERCTIREFVSADISSFMEYRNNMDWMRYQGFKGMPKEFYETALLHDGSLEKGKQLAIVNTDTRQLVGDIYVRKDNNIYWIGYTVHPTYARKGYSTEAVVAAIKWVANQGGSMIRAGVLPANTASINFLEKLKFTYLRKEEDELVYSYEIQQK